MKRGSLVTVALQGDFGKPRPAVVIQSDFFADTATVTVLPLSSSLMSAPLLRVDVQPEPANSRETGCFSAADFRDHCGIGRNTVIEVLEHFDRAGLTRRQGQVRRLRRKAAGLFAG